METATTFSRDQILKKNVILATGKRLKNKWKSIAFLLQVESVATCISNQILKEHLFPADGHWFCRSIFLQNYFRPVQKKKMFSVKCYCIKSNCSQEFCRKIVLKIYRIFTPGWRLASFLKQDLNSSLVFSFEFSKNFKLTDRPYLDGCFYLFSG